MKRLIMPAMCFALILAVCVVCIAVIKEDKFDRQYAQSITPYEWDVQAIATEYELFSDVRSGVRLDLSRYEKWDKRISATLFISEDNFEISNYETLSIGNHVHFEYVNWHGLPEVQYRYEERDHGAQRFLSLSDFPAKRQWEEKRAEQAELSGPNRFVLDAVKKLSSSKADLPYDTWNYAVTIQGWRGKALVTEEQYLPPKRYWNRPLRFEASDVLALPSGEISHPKGTLFFRVDEKSKALLSIEGDPL